jgi:hypothetical protein
MCYLYDTGEKRAIHIKDISKSTILDSFVYPLVALRRSRSKNGYIRNDVNGGNISKTGQYSEFVPEKQQTA